MLSLVLKCDIPFRTGTTCSSTMLEYRTLEYIHTHYFLDYYMKKVSDTDTNSVMSSVYILTAASNLAEAKCQLMGLADKRARHGRSGTRKPLKELCHRQFR